MNYYPFHIGDYASATRHLTWDEDLAYRRLLDAYYTREEPIPLELRQAYRLVCASTEQQREAVDSVLTEFFIETEIGFRHQRCDAEIEAAQDKRSKASQSAHARWRNANGSGNAMPSESERNANASQTPCERINNSCEGNAPNPNPNPNPKGKPKPLSDYPQEFEEAWAAYPCRPGANKKAAYKAWAARMAEGVGHQIILNGVIGYAKWCAAMKTEPQYIKQPATFFGPADHFMNDWTIPSGGINGKNGSTRADRISATIAELTGANRHPAPAIDGIAERVD